MYPRLYFLFLKNLRASCSVTYSKPASISSFISLGFLATLHMYSSFLKLTSCVYFRVYLMFLLEGSVSLQCFVYFFSLFSFVLLRWYLFAAFIASQRYSSDMP